MGGQRRRVQIMLGLVRPFKILLLDEITTSLDVCVRQDLLQWIVKESDERGATILYATHIFDGLDDWATHLFYLNSRGKCGWQGKMSELEKYQELKRIGGSSSQKSIRKSAVCCHGAGSDRPAGWIRQWTEHSDGRNHDDTTTATGNSGGCDGQCRKNGPESQNDRSLRGLKFVNERMGIKLKFCLDLQSKYLSPRK